MSAKDVPKVVWEYWGWTHSGLPAGLYGMDARRSECHDRLCKLYGLTKEQTKEVTDNLDKYEDAEFLHLALKQIKKEVTMTSDKLMEEFDKAIEGKPSLVELVDFTTDELAIEKAFQDAGIEFAFGTGFKDRTELLEYLKSK